MYYLVFVLKEGEKKKPEKGSRRRRFPFPERQAASHHFLSALHFDGRIIDDADPVSYFYTGFRKKTNRKKRTMTTTIEKVSCIEWTSRQLIKTYLRTSENNQQSYIYTHLYLSK